MFAICQCQAVAPQNLYHTTPVKQLCAALSIFEVDSDQFTKLRDCPILRVSFGDEELACLVILSTAYPHRIVACPRGLGMDW